MGHDINDISKRRHQPVVYYTNGGAGGAMSIFQLLGYLPRKDVTTKVTINCCALVDWLLQVEIPETENKFTVYKTEVQYV